MPLLGLGKTAPISVEEQLEDLERRRLEYTPYIARCLGQHCNTDRVKDVWQEALTKMAKRLRDGDEPVLNIGGYMRSVCHTCAMDELRAIASRAEVLFGHGTAVLEQHENVPLDDSGVYWADIGDELKILLTDMERRALYFTCVHDFTAKQAAVAMSAPYANVRKALTRAKKKIAKYKPGLGRDA
ncbi:RNA polymerase sigma factor [Streptomyces sp. NPDC059443]|uniref:RNA polymerase sigma factor n=1 Tax=unclassified Streptomyces TaxID=2593676 RepID=UPI0036A8A5C5